MELIHQAKSRMLLKHPFFATPILTTPIKVREDIPTAATDMKNIFYNPKFFEGMNADEVQFVFAHEVLHIIFKHGLRKQYREMPLWNRACDYVINRILTKEGIGKMPTGKKAGLLDSQYDGMSEEQIYAQLLKDQKDGGGGGGSRTGSGSGEDGDGGGMTDDILDLPDNLSPADIAKIEMEINRKIIEATNTARLMGKMPGEVERLIDDLINPKLPWQDLLRDYMTRMAKADETWSRRNTRYSHVVLPGRNSINKLGPAYIIGDTSGSMGPDDLADQVGVIMNVVEDCQPEKTHIIWADAGIQREEEFEEGMEIVPHPAGGGGTDMRIPLDYVEQYDPAFVILITDGYTPWPSVEPPYPLFVVYTTDAPVPVGMTVRV